MGFFDMLSKGADSLKQTAAEAAVNTAINQLTSGAASYATKFGMSQDLTKTAATALAEVAKKAVIEKIGVEKVAELLNSDVAKKVVTAISSSSDPKAVVLDLLNQYKGTAAQALIKLLPDNLEPVVSAFVSSIAAKFKA